MKFEICCGDIASVVAARDAGADRVELCSSLSEGGITPSVGFIQQALLVDGVDINVIIRPRGGDFVYSDEEMDIMVQDIVTCRELGVNGVVFGVLNPDWSVDCQSNSMLLAYCEGLETTFHRAFDLCDNLFESIDEIIKLGFDRVLTSGGCVTVSDGRDVLKELTCYVEDRISVMPGCGVNIDNIKEIVDYTSASEIHFSASVVRENFTKQGEGVVDFGDIPKTSSGSMIRDMIARFK